MFFRGIQKLFLGFPKKKPDWRNNAFLVIIFTFLGIAGLPLKKKTYFSSEKTFEKVGRIHWLHDIVEISREKPPANSCY